MAFLPQHRPDSKVYCRTASSSRAQAQTGDKKCHVKSLAYTRPTPSLTCNQSLSLLCCPQVIFGILTPAQSTSQTVLSVPYCLSVQGPAA